MERFNRKWQLDPATGCWEWQGCKNRKGYGDFWNPQGERLAHRLSYVLHNGPIPPGLLVCHKCDNPGCVNPKHLFLGTDKVNADDRAAKGRSAKGERNGRAKLTDEQVRQIRASTGTQAAVAKQFGISNGMVWKIRNGAKRASA